MAVIAIRRVLSDDSLEELTGMLRPAFAPLGHCGLNCTCVGHALLRKAEAWVRGRQYLELALDTPDPAEHLHLYYGIHGFRRMDTVQLEGKFYRSVVLSKSIACPVRRLGAHAWPAGDPASMALLTRPAPSRRRRSMPSIGQRAHRDHRVRPYERTGRSHA